MVRIKKDIGEEIDVSLHGTAISVAEDISIRGVEFGKEAGLQKDATKAVLVGMEEKDVLVHEAEISVVSIPAKKERRMLYLSQESVNENWRISKLV